MILFDTKYLQLLPLLIKELESPEFDDEAAAAACFLLYWSNDAVLVCLRSKLFAFPPPSISDPPES